MPFQFKDRLAMSPPGGWHYIEGGTTFRGDNPEEVEEKIREYRLRNGIPAGNPKNDILNFCAMRWPNLLSQSDQAPVVVEKNPIIQQAWNWVVSLSHYTNPGDVPFDQADAQIAICKACPLNLPYPKDEDMLRDDLERRSFLLRKGRPCDLGFCMHHRWDNRVAVYRNRNALNARENGPNYCWMNRELEGLKLSSPGLQSGT